MWTNIGQILILAAIGEAIWETLKMVWEKKALADSKGRINPDKIGALAVGILVAFGARMDLFVLVGIPLSIPYLGYILTGVLISRGANFVHDLWTNFSALKEVALNKADTAKNDREGAIKVSSKIAEGTKIKIDNSEAASLTGKIKNTGKSVSQAAARVIKVIRSTPTIKSENKVEPETKTVPIGSISPTGSEDISPTLKDSDEGGSGSPVIEIKENEEFKDI